MSAKALVYLIVLITLSICVCQGGYRTFPIWHYNASLDFDGKNLTVETQPAVMNTDSVTNSIFFRGSSTADWGAIYILDTRESDYSVPSEDTLRSLMMPSCKAISINPGNIDGRSGLIAKAEARVEHGFGQNCYGGIIQVTPPGPNELTLFAIIGHFTNESFNEHFVKTAKISYSG